MTDDPRDRDAAGSADAEGTGAPSLESWSGAPEQSTWTSIDPDADTGTGAGGERVRRPSSLLGDTPIPPRAAALRSSLSEKIASVSHGGSGGAPTGGDAGAGGGTPIGGTAPLQSEQPIERLRRLIAERPEVAVGAAFVGGLVLASILKRLAR